jgi:hypothetical protein
MASVRQRTGGKVWSLLGVSFSFLALGQVRFGMVQTHHEVWKLITTDPHASSWQKCLPYFILCILHSSLWGTFS